MVTLLAVVMAGGSLGRMPASVNLAAIFWRPHYLPSRFSNSKLLRPARSAIQRPTFMSTQSEIKPAVGILMGSDSDWPTMKQAADALTEFGIASEARVISAHRDPRGLEEYV